MAKQEAQAAVAQANGRHAEAFSAIALGLAGDSAQAERMAGDLAKRFDQDTIVQFDYLPMIRAAIALQSGNAGKALEALNTSLPYEMGQTNSAFTFALYPAYLRGQSYLATKQGAAAASEFQKILDHPGVIGNQPIGALARLGQGRAYALSGDTTKAKAAYQDFSPVERRRPRQPRPEASQGGVREVAIAGSDVLIPFRVLAHVSLSAYGSTTMVAIPVIIRRYKHLRKRGTLVATTQRDET